MACPRLEVEIQLCRWRVAWLHAIDHSFVWLLKRLAAVDHQYHEYASRRNWCKQLHSVPNMGRVGLIAMPDGAYQLPQDG